MSRLSLLLFHWLGLGALDPCELERALRFEHLIETILRCHWEVRADTGLRLFSMQLASSEDFQLRAVVRYQCLTRLIHGMHHIHTPAIHAVISEVFLIHLSVNEPAARALTLRWLTCAGAFPVPAILVRGLPVQIIDHPVLSGHHCFISFAGMSFFA